MMDHNLEAGLRLVDAGFYVHPCDPNPRSHPKSKSPLTSWLSASTCLASGVRYFSNRYPGAVYGVHLEKANAVVVGLDRHSGGHDGVAEFDAMLDHYGSSLNGVPIVETASGGYHLWFAQPPDRERLKNRKGALEGLGIDIKAGNGYVIGPGAVMHDGTCYACVAGWPDLCETFRAKTLRPIFPWLVELIEAPVPGRERSPFLSGAARERSGTGGGPWRRVNDVAMNNHDKWVPQLGLYRCQRTRDGFRAVATWRPSNTGRRPEQRKQNLSISRRGITDFGNGPKGYSPIDLVMAARGCDFVEAYDWLEQLVDPPAFTIDIKAILASYDRKRAAAMGPRPADDDGRVTINLKPKLAETKYDEAPMQDVRVLARHQHVEWILSAASTEKA